MIQMNTYQIQLLGQVNVNNLNAMSPFQMTVVQADATGTRLAIYADQSGLIGLLGHLHGLGYEILSVSCNRKI